MAMIDETVLVVGGTTPETITREDIIEAVRRQAWGWYEANKDTILFKRTVIIFPVTIRVKDCRRLFEMLFGPNPNMEI